MTTKLVFNRFWVQDYRDRVKQQIKAIEHICIELKAVKDIADPILADSLETLIQDFENLRSELIIISEVLEQFIDGVDEAKSKLDSFVKEMRDLMTS